MYRHSKDLEEKMPSHIVYLSWLLHVFFCLLFSTTIRLRSHSRGFCVFAETVETFPRVMVLHHRNAGEKRCHQIASLNFVVSFSEVSDLGLLCFHVGCEFFLLLILLTVILCFYFARTPASVDPLLVPKVKKAALALMEPALVWHLAVYTSREMEKDVQLSFI